jgi:4-amino-4-deoxy-L-arabinose transferase-like glycosyltransferase
LRDNIYTKYFLIFFIAIVFGFSVLILRNLYESKTGKLKSHWNTVQLEGDSKNFFDRGLSISLGNHYFSGCENAPIVAFFRPPGFPFFLALSFKIFGDSMKAVIVLQIIIASLIAVLVALISNLVFRNNIVTWISGILTVLYYPMWNDAVIINSELLSMFLGLIALYFILKFYYSELISLKLIVLSGIFTGLASLTRGQFFFYSLLFFFIIYSVSNLNTAGKIKFIFIWTAFALIPILIWSFYAYITTGLVIFISSQGPLSIWWGWSPLVVVEEHYPVWNSLWDRNFVQDDMIGNYLPYKSSGWFLNEAYTFIVKYPVDSLKIAYFKFLDCWGFIDIYTGNNFLSKTTRILKLNWDLFLAIPAFVLLWKNKDYKVFTSYILYACILFTFVSIMTAGLVRYRIPYLDPLLIILASYTVYKIYLRFISKNKIITK